VSTANERLFDASLRHAVDVRRFTTSEILDLLAILEEADRDTAARLREKLGGARGRLQLAKTAVQRQSLRLILRDIKNLRAAAIREIERRLREDLLSFAEIEVAAETAAVKGALTFDVMLAGVQARKLRAIVASQPFSGRPLGSWFRTLRAADQHALSKAVELGLAAGESTDSIVRRVAGTRANNYRDGALAITRRNAEAVVRTAINHVSNGAREEFFDENRDVIAYRRWTSTLDGRTSPICRARDGAIVVVGDRPVPEGARLLEPQSARPPAHVGCRSLLVGVIDGEGAVGERPFVADKRRPGKREADFRKEARRTGRDVKDVRRDWARKNVGTVPAETTYGQWLARQPAAVQDEILGKSQGALFRRGGLRIDQFVDRRGNALTLAKLREKYPGAFDRANLEA
jgi:SPP1 gp7 family putative phage head morphogenesis protein